MHKPLLIEIGVEELPAIPFLKELGNIKKKWDEILKENKLESECEFYYTPRRLIFWHPNFLLKQADTKEEFFGAPISIAFKDNKPTNAAIGFAKKVGVDVSELQTTTHKGKEVLYYQKEVIGKEAKELLNQMINKLIKKLHFGKSMRWGNIKESFIRPIRWLVVLLGDENIKCELFGVSSSNFTYSHRSFSHEKQIISSSEHYLDFLQKRGIIADPNKRKEKILQDFKIIEKEENITIQIDEELLNEVIAITEYPTAFLGSFDKEFLELPNEVIITSMKTHQRYFAVYKDGKLSNHFIVVANSLTDNGQEIIKGNEKVLKARLSDALFFYRNDLKNALNCKGVENIIFTNELGTLFDKTYREQAIASEIQRYLDLDDETYTKVYEAVQIAKCDLVTEMVYEFPELQGVMGYYYALSQNRDKEVALALKEQYMPEGENSPLPSTHVGSILSMAVKYDNLMGLFSTNKIPTGNKDPFALRRAAIGIVRIIINQKYHIPQKTFLKRISKNFENFNIDVLENFIYDRLYQIINVNASIIKAVLATGEDDIYNIYQKSLILDKFVKKEDFANIHAIFKRVANITKDISQIKVFPELFENEYEKALYNKFIQIKEKDYEKLLESLSGLKTELDNFFDHVMVNVDDKQVRDNRKSLVASIHQKFKEVGDIALISI